MICRRISFCCKYKQRLPTLPYSFLTHVRDCRTDVNETETQMIYRRDNTSVHISSFRNVFHSALLIANAFHVPTDISEMTTGHHTVIKLLTEGIFKIYDSFRKFRLIVYDCIGLIDRADKRLLKPSLELSNDSLILVATVDDNSEQRSRIVGVAEVTLEIPDGRLPQCNAPYFPFKRRKTQQELSSDVYQPYLSNICVDRNYRGRGIGKQLCVACERVAKRVWHKDAVYLHVERVNRRARDMYEHMGYMPVDGAFSSDKVKVDEEEEEINMADYLYYVRDL